MFFFLLIYCLWILNILSDCRLRIHFLNNLYINLLKKKNKFVKFLFRLLVIKKLFDSKFTVFSLFRKIKLIFILHVNHTKIIFSSYLTSSLFFVPLLIRRSHHCRPYFPKVLYHFSNSHKTNIIAYLYLYLSSLVLSKFFFPTLHSCILTLL